MSYHRDDRVPDIRQYFEWNNAELMSYQWGGRERDKVHLPWASTQVIVINT